jgi:hypothetical protein
MLVIIQFHSKMHGAYDMKFKTKLFFCSAVCVIVGFCIEVDEGILCSVLWGLCSVYCVRLLDFCMLFAG